MAVTKNSDKYAPAITRRSVDLGDVTLSYLEAGKGPLLVLVHGSVTTSELFRETIGHFSDRYRVVAVDLRGYGDSSKPPSGYTMQGFSDDLAAFFDALNLPPAVLLGVSMGGFVVQLFALQHAHRLNGLVLASTSDGHLGAAVDFSDFEADFEEKGWRAISRDLIVDAFPPGTASDIVDPLLARIDTWNDTVISGAIESILSFSTTERLGDIVVPVQIMVGALDAQLPVSLSEDLARAIPKAELVVFPDCGHFMMIEAPEMFRRELGRFLGELAV